MVSEALISSLSLFHLHSSLNPKQTSPQFVIRTSIVVTPKKSTKSSLSFPSSNQTSSVVIRRCADAANPEPLRTCKNCKTQFDPSLNHPSACRFHTAHFGGETKRKFESAYSGGTMSTPDSGQVYQYWHCCGSEDPFDPGCTAAPHSSYDD